jgi:glycosyltransferase involved in cell wall biosynthesis
VTFTGRVPHSEVKGLYTIADVVCYPRRLTLTTALTTPLKPLEAMAMARAVVVSDVPPMQELVQHNSTGFHFAAGNHIDLADKCLTLLADPARRAQLGDAARTWVVSERQWPTLVSRYRAIYEGILSHSFRHGEKVPA